ncbi:MAG: hypothetical protein RMJ51_06685 [Candidatus Calescibacterium sp.]|nr:hypothetical protein [Candidatus Calescibacterium sp.]MCX7758407.1 hypothetical protein [bacterium]MDW8195901.1 hypothetical protein [Candidatus Calescibacterium sp.]
MSRIYNILPFIFSLLLFSYASNYYLYIFNIPIDPSLFVVEGNYVWVDQKVIDIIKTRIEIKVDPKYFDRSRNKYLLDGICEDNKDKIVLKKNKETNIIDVNSFKSTFSNHQIISPHVNDNTNLQYKTLELKYFRLYYTNHQLGLILSKLLDIYYENIVSFFEFRSDELLRLNYKVPIYLAPTDDVYKSYNLVPDWSTGAFVFEFFSSTPIFAIYAHERDSFLIQRVLPHEITHLILCLYWKENAIDYRTKFIQEGVAQYNEYRLLTGLEEIVIHPSVKIPLENLLYPRFDSAEAVKAFYENSIAFTSFLICSYGKRKYIEFIRKTKYSLDIIKNLNDIYKFVTFYNESVVIKYIEDRWDYFIKTRQPTILN